MFNRLVVVVILALAVLISTTAIAEDSLDGNVKILVHGVNGSGPVVLSGWLIGVNLAQDPSKWFRAGNPRRVQRREVQFFHQHPVD
ncbi:MAG: hypothetical protein UY20_C0005G0025 [Candidatus Yanofskybacteria bacterium GW2011_GWA1_48_10]|uniref:Uncharacterized protein n=1 Tax=Candidatus Yanofskybacteria bacterium GW2011_GWA1_48_10 TaxID=1619022 RepID=A0A0G1U6S9_9BACT|nr:MAG: hypothetical protein UY20_C0005G0025 [Candidatus Yanofskybacteria bacterium GW2011_GWA1_48_10]